MTFLECSTSTCAAHSAWACHRYPEVHEESHARYWWSKNCQRSKQLGKHRACQCTNPQLQPSSVKLLACRPRSSEMDGKVSTIDQCMLTGILPFFCLARRLAKKLLCSRPRSCRKSGPLQSSTAASTPVTNACAAVDLLEACLVQRVILRSSSRD